MLAKTCLLFLPNREAESERGREGKEAFYVLSSNLASTSTSAACCVDVVLKSQKRRVAFSRILTETWSSLVEGDEQLDRPNSQKTVELCYSCVA